ncbi:hypothetical protein CLU79DRAFT_761550 [Phycomyces nitens]|nr:hypothetical protein CLU79DRAFT_761550 [Phycomyces nitens]
MTVSLILAVYVCRWIDCIIDSSCTGQNKFLHKHILEGLLPCSTNVCALKKIIFRHKAGSLCENFDWQIGWKH